VTVKQNVTAVIYDRRGRVLSIGKNSYTRTHPIQAKHAEKVGLPDKQYLHAETHAVLRLRDLSKAYRIAVFRYDTKGKPRLAKPCPVCESLIASIPSIKVVEWTTSEEDN